MTYKGKVKGNVIELDEPLALPDGTRVDVTVEPEAALRKGSPGAILALVGTLQADEAEDLRQSTQQVRRIDPSLWSERA